MTCTSVSRIEIMAGFEILYSKLIESCVVLNSFQFQVGFSCEWVTGCSKSGRNQVILSTNYYPFHDITLHILPIKIYVFLCSGLNSQNTRARTLLTKNGSVYKKRMLVSSSSPIQPFFEKVQQQNKFLLIFHERGQSLKVRHTFCLDNFLSLSLLYFVTFNFLIIGIHSMQG